MSNAISANEAALLVQRLTGYIENLRGREEGLRRDDLNRTRALEKALEGERARLQEMASLGSAQVEQQLREAEALLESRYQARKARISRAQISSKKLLLHRIEEIEGHRKYKAQKGMFDADRGRAPRIGESNERFQRFQQEVEGHREGLNALEVQARKAFGGYSAFRKALNLTAEIDRTKDSAALFAVMLEKRSAAEEALARFKRSPLPLLFRFLPLWLWFVLVMGLVAAAPFAGKQLTQLPDFKIIAGAGVALLVMITGLFFFGRKGSKPLAESLARDLVAALALHQAALEKAAVENADETQRIEQESRDSYGRWQKEYESAAQFGEAARQEGSVKLDDKWRRVVAKHEQLKLKRTRDLHAEKVLAADSDTGRARAEADALKAAYQVKFETLKKELENSLEALKSEWTSGIQPLLEQVRSAENDARQLFPGWEEFFSRAWTPPKTFLNQIKIGELQVHLGQTVGLASAPSELVLPASSLNLPISLEYPNEGSFLIETNGSGREAAIACLNNILFRLLATTPPGKLSFTLIDPVALGESFSAIMHLADYEEALVNGRIWTEPQQIEDKLSELNAHMEKVIQMYLRNEFQTIAEYNIQAGKIAEKYHFVVIADFPANFSESALRRLIKIATSGARCGVYVLIHWDKRVRALVDLDPEEFARHGARIEIKGTEAHLAKLPGRETRLLLDPPPIQEAATRFLQAVGVASQGSNRVQVPFSQVAPKADEVWSLETTDELRVPIGRSGATKLQYLALGKGTRQHVLMAGKTGSGKSTLLHVMVTNLALWHSPDQVEFYLLDFKKGVEFKDYASLALPHARVVGIESDREFGLSVLRRVDEELRSRGELFRAAGAQDVAGYKNAAPGRPLPRVLLIIDEFQELFVEDDSVSQTAAMLLDRIVRQGRAFGIHVILGSQTLGGSYTLARTTLGQMVIRIALQCNEADAYLIMDENNPAPRLLSRPGEGIYNDMAGAIEGNSPFQTVWLSETERREALTSIRSLARERFNIDRRPIVFEGNTPSDIKENHQLQALLDGPRALTGPAATRAWLGLPNEIKGPTEAVFRPRSGSNLLIVGQREEPSLALIVTSLLSLAAQFPPGGAKFFVLDGSPSDSNEHQVLSQLAAEMGDGRYAQGSQLAEVLDELSQELEKRQNGGRGPSIFLVVHRLQTFRGLRQEDEFSVSFDGNANQSPANFQKLIVEGGPLGIHVIVTVDTFNNVNRFIGRKGIREFEMRVLFQMSPNDSSSLCDDPKASNLGLHRALLYNEQEGSFETFRPYALPPSDWLEEVVKKLNSNGPQAQSVGGR